MLNHCCLRGGISLLLCLALVACQWAPKPVEPVDSRDAAVVRLEPDCPVVKQGVPRAQPTILPALAIALAPVLAEVIVDGTSALLEKQKADRNFTTIAKGSGALLADSSQSLQLASKCVVVFRGVLGPWDEARPDGKLDKNGELTRTAMQGLGLAGFPDFYYEAWLTSEPARSSATANDSKAINITVTPKLVHFASTGARSEGSGKKSIGLLLVLSKKVVSGKSDQDFSGANATLPVLFKDITIGTELVDKATTANGIFQDQVGSFGLDASASGSLNLYAVLNETEEPRLFEDLIIKSLSSKSSDLKKSLTDIITDAIKEAGKTSEKNAAK